MATKMPTSHQPSDETIESQLCSFGARLRELRLQRGWTLQELAWRGGLSKAYVSRLESGDRQASIAVVLTLCQIFGVSLASLFESPLATEPCVIVRASEAMEKTINGLKYVPLSNPGRFFNLQPLRVKVSPSRRGKDHSHPAADYSVNVSPALLILTLPRRPDYSP